MKTFSRTGALLAGAAALSMMATPALARDPWGGWGSWGGGWGRHHHDDGIDAGDVIAGVLILGGIAAIASAASKAKKDQQHDRPDYRYPDQRRDSDRGYNGQGDDNRPDWGQSRGIGPAVDRCASEVERGDRRIDTIDTVNRDGDGWRVEGHLQGGKPFACSVDGDGRIRSVQMDGHAI